MRKILKKFIHYIVNPVFAKSSLYSELYLLKIGLPRKIHNIVNIYYIAQGRRSIGGFGGAYGGPEGPLYPKKALFAPLDVL